MKTKQVVLKNKGLNHKYSWFGKSIPNLAIGPVPSKGMQRPPELAKRYESPKRKKARSISPSG